MHQNIYSYLKPLIPKLYNNKEELLCNKGLLFEKLIIIILDCKQSDKFTNFTMMYVFFCLLSPTGAVKIL